MSAVTGHRSHRSADHPANGPDQPNRLTAPDGWPVDRAVGSRTRLVPPVIQCSPAAWSEEAGECGPYRGVAVEERRTGAGHEDSVGFVHGHQAGQVTGV